MANQTSFGASKKIVSPSLGAFLFVLEGRANEMDTLRVLLRDDPHDEGLPFSSAVSEKRVLDAVLVAELDQNWKARVRQWINFNKACNMYEGEPYQTWVATVYSRIEAKLSEAECYLMTGGLDMRQETQLPEPLSQ